MTNPIATRTASLATSQLIEMASALFVDTRDEAGIVFDAVINTLEQRLPGAEFVALCEELGA